MSAEKITVAEFKEKLSKYPALIKTYSRPAKEGQLTLEELDKFRYYDAPSQFSKKAGGKVLDAASVRKLVDWKVKHGTFRPNLQKLVASNPDEVINSVLKDAFTLYSKDPTDLKTVIAKITELKGIGPSAASLILSVHDPENIVFFSDEAYRWLCHSGSKVTPKYTTSELEDLFAKAKALSAKLRVTALDIEKVAFVILKEDEPVKVPKLKKEPSGRPAGRPKLPEDQKKPKKEPSGRGRGRPAGSVKTKVEGGAKKVAGKRGRPAGVKTEASATPAKSGKRKAEDEVKEEDDAPKSGKKAKA